MPDSESPLLVHLPDARIRREGWNSDKNDRYGALVRGVTYVIGIDPAEIWRRGRDSNPGTSHPVN